MILPNSLVEIDPETNEVVQVIPVGNAPVAVAVVGESVWVANGEDDTLTRFDPATGITRSIGGVDDPSSVSGDGEGGVWVGRASASEVLRLDAVAGSVSDRVPLRGQFVTVGLGSLWISEGFVLGGPPTVRRIGLETGLVEQMFGLPEGAVPAEITTGADSVWVALFGLGVLLRIDPETSRTTRISAAGPPSPRSAWKRSGLRARRTTSSEGSTRSRPRRMPSFPFRAGHGESRSETALSGWRATSARPSRASIRGEDKWSRRSVPATFPPRSTSASALSGWPWPRSASLVEVAGSYHLGRGRAGLARGASNDRGDGAEEAAFEAAQEGACSRQEAARAPGAAAASS